MRPTDNGTRASLIEGLRACFGGFGGRALGLLFWLWGVLLLAVHALQAARRLGGETETPILFGLLLFALALYLSRGKLTTLARSAEIFYLILAVAVLAVLLLAAPRVSLGYVFLLDRQALFGLPQAALTLLGYGAVGLYALFFMGQVARREDDRRVLSRRLVLLCVSLSALMFLILGCFGAALMAKLPQPFFQMVAALGLPGAFQRLEALFSALWMLGDLSLLSLLLYAQKGIGQELLGLRGRRVALAVPLLLGFGLFAFLAQRSALFAWCYDVLLPRGGLLCGVLLLLGLLCMKRREKLAQRLAEKELPDCEKSA